VTEFELFKIQWRMPHVALNNINKLMLRAMLRALESGHHLSMSFRSWDLYEYPLLQNTTKHRLSKQRLNLRSDMLPLFCRPFKRIPYHEMLTCSMIYYNLSNVKVYLNSNFYPYDDLNGF